ncbi:MAG: hypothetical protein BWY13_00219 [Euryarchaeota archaeon ADurb.Bin190]|nr:hypothetical protein [Methanothrix sp.]OQB27103.1 MAG: hypothetical protein BWY13_00219 [Euryarchaeota archaeon ADurb.Bin190]HNQ55071.1 hypothetical protein [Methanothrix sp.]HNU40325.1 hypothetical protein [Methanothrix sp.]HQQ37741.1 hypothetical protein [Methanothrix sp.]
MIGRAVPLLTEQVRMLSGAPQAELEGMVRDYDNQRVLREAVRDIQKNLEGQTEELEE